MLYFLESLRQKIIEIRGWKRNCLALSFGMLGVLALPPFLFLPLILVSLVVFNWILDGILVKTSDHSKAFVFFQSFLTGWCFGLGFFLGGLYWVYNSFFVDPEKFAWLSPFAVLVLSSGMALYIGFTASFTCMFSRPGISRLVNICIFWVVFELIRGWAFTGFPWNLLATVWANTPQMIQIASILGVFGLSFITLVLASSIAVLGHKEIGVRKRIIFSFSLFLIPVMVWGYGEVRLYYSQNQNVAGVLLRLVQPNINQKDKWKPLLINKHINTLLSMSTRESAKFSTSPTHIIWPETATPFYLSKNKVAVELLEKISPKKGALITGSPRANLITNIEKRIWNSIHVITSKEGIMDTYDKRHLVPFGEYVPFRQFLKLSKIVAGRMDFSPGIETISLKVPNAPKAIPTICYEGIFQLKNPELVANRQVGWLLNLTNDAWFGDSSGPYQHLEATRFRALEHGLPLVRVANTGLSAVIDPYGRTIVSSRLNEKTTIDSILPTKLAKGTIFSKYGNWTLVLLLLLFFSLLNFKTLKALVNRSNH